MKNVATGKCFLKKVKSENPSTLIGISKYVLKLDKALSNLLHPAGTSIISD